MFSGLQWQPPSQTAAAEAAAAVKAAAAAEEEQDGKSAPPPPPLYRPPVENVLERALSLSGAITPSNSGNPAKIGWTRSSRTDAGVHSLSTVVSLRAECDPESFELRNDPEGAAFAATLNAFLPEDIRVFSAQRVNGGWCARGMCEAREYEYTLPARILTPSSLRKKSSESGSGNGEDGIENDHLEAAVARLEEVLSLYLGQRPFHNFTVRREYRFEVTGSRKEPRDNRRQRLGRMEGGSGSASSFSVLSTSSSNDSEGDENEGAAAACQQRQRSSSPSSPPSASYSSAGGPCGSKRQVSSTSSLAEAEGGEQTRLPFVVRPLWLEETPAGDKVGPAHWRRVDVAKIVFPERGGGEGGRGEGGPRVSDGSVSTTTSATTSSSSSPPAAAAPLVPGGEPALTIRISGGSFMLRQLRHMIGAAVAVARGSLPSAAVVAAALRVPARLSLPLAPPHTLVLTGARFGAYPAKALAPGDVSPWLGDRLELRQNGGRAAREFRESRLHAALDGWLSHEDWDLWAEQLDRLSWDDEEITEFVARAEADARAAEERAREQRSRGEKEEDEGEGGEGDKTKKKKSGGGQVV